MLFPLKHPRVSMDAANEAYLHGAVEVIQLMLQPGAEIILQDVRFDALQGGLLPTSWSQYAVSGRFSSRCWCCGSLCEREAQAKRFFVSSELKHSPKLVQFPN